MKQSENPYADLRAIAYPGQPLEMRQYHCGYESYFMEMPTLDPANPFFKPKQQYATRVMQGLADKIIEDGMLLQEREKLTFARTVIGIESPTITDTGKLKDGSEIIIAHWGEGFTSPVHGHAPGYHHEEILNGTIRANTYRQVDPASNIVRPVRTDLYTKGTMVAVYEEAPADSPFPRPLMIHSFTAVGGPANTLHFLPEHSRDGRDNGFKVEYFGEVHHLDFKNVLPISVSDALQLRIGDVVLVRSNSVPEYGDHYIVVTGAPILKPHGLRVQEVAIHAPEDHARNMLDFYDYDGRDVVLLKLGLEAEKRFREFHDIHIIDGKVVFPHH